MVIVADMIHWWTLLACRAADQLRNACRHQAVHRSVISLADQMIVSATSFLTIVFLGRACLPEELGLYSVGFSLVTTLLGIPNALIWTPYTNFTPRMSDEELRWYSGSTFAHQMLLGAAMALGVSAAGGLIWQTGGAQDLGLMLVVLGPVLLLVSMREYIRRVCLSRFQVRHALAADVAITVLQASGMLLLATFGLLSASRAYLVVGAASLPVIIVWSVLNRPTFSLQRIRIASDFAKNWQLSRWLLASSLVFSVNDMLYPWVLSWRHGTTAVGMLSAANGAILLANPLILGFSNFFGPHVADVSTRIGLSGLYRQVMIAWFAISTIMFLITLALVFWGGEFVSLLFGAKYAGQENLIFALALGQFAEVASIPFALGLIAIGRGDSLLTTYVIRLALTATLGLWCVEHFGSLGVGYGRALSNFGAVACQWSLLRALSLPREAES